LPYFSPESGFLYPLFCFFPLLSPFLHLFFLVRHGDIIYNQEQEDMTTLKRQHRILCFLDLCRIAWNVMMKTYKYSQGNHKSRENEGRSHRPELSMISPEFPHPAIKGRLKWEM
jgi:hypothetical protein